MRKRGLREINMKPIYNQISSCVTLFLCILCITYCAVSDAHAKGGDELWQLREIRPGQQVPTAATVDSLGNVIITGVTDEDGTDDYFTAKFSNYSSKVLWTKKFKLANNEDHATAVVVDSANNIIVSGYCWDGSGHYAVVTIKYDPAGNVLWQDTFPGNGGDAHGMAVTVDTNGNVYVAGYEEYTANDYDFLILKYAAGGGAPTPIRYPHAGQDHITSITSGSGGIAVTGYMSNGANGYDIMTVKYDFNGNKLWEKLHGGIGEDMGKHLKIDPAGNVIMTGYTTSGTTLRDIYTAKYNAANGDVIWDISYNNTESNKDDEPMSLWLDGDGNVLITGYTYTMSGAEDFYTAKYRGATREVIWEKIYNSYNGNADQTVPTGLVTNQSGDVFVTGHSYKMAQNNEDFQTIKYKKDTGNEVWMKSFNNTANRNDIPVSLGLAPDGNVYVMGSTDVGTLSVPDFDYYVIKYDFGALDKPTGLTAITKSSTEIELKWSDNSATTPSGNHSEDKFFIEWKIGDFAENEETPSERIIEVPAGTTTYNHIPLVPYTKYYYRIRAFNSTDGYSEYSATAHALTVIINFQEPAWVYTFSGGDGINQANAIAVGRDNNPVITGSNTSIAYHTIKVNRGSGERLWYRNYDSGEDDSGQGKAVTVDTDGDVIVTGFSTITTGGIRSNDVYTTKYPENAASGTDGDDSVPLWGINYNGPASNDDRAVAIATTTDANKNTVVVGYGFNTSGNTDIYVIKYTAAGALAWPVIVYDGGNNDQPTGVALDANGNIFVTGWSFNGLNYDMFTAKYDGTTGVELWKDVYDSTRDERANAIAVDTAGNAYVTGYAANASGNTDFYTIKYHGTTKAKLWTDGGASYNGPANGNDEAKSVKIDPVSGDVIVAGTMFASVGNNDFHVIRYYSIGGVKWERTVDRELNDDCVVSMDVDRSGNICVAGNTICSSFATDMMSVMLDYEGNISSLTTKGTAGEADACTSVAINNFGEAFIAGYATNALGGTDFIVYKCGPVSLEVPTPVVLTPSYRTIGIAWKDNSLDETGYKIYRKTGTCSVANTNPFELKQTTLQNANSWTDTDAALTTGTEYCYGIQAFKDNGETSRWYELPVTTLTPLPPKDITPSVAGTTRIDLTWTSQTNGQEDGFTVQRCDQGTTCDSQDTFTADQTFTAAKSATGYSDTTVCVNSGITYRYRVIAYKTGAGSWQSTPSLIIQSATAAIPAVPTLNDLVKASEVQINLSWTFASSDIDGFHIEKCKGVACSLDTPDDVITVPADARSYYDYAIEANETYKYRIHAYKTTAYCSWQTGNSAEKTTIAITTSPSALSLSSPNTTQVDLQWTDNTASETGFLIERNDGTGWQPVQPPAGINAIMYSDTGVCKATPYDYRISAFKNGLSNSGGGCWTKRKKLTITNFHTDYQTTITLTYANFPGMKTDFSDIRFYDASAGYELPYWIQSKTDGVTATVLIKTGGNNNIYIYYGNASAVSSSSYSSIYKVIAGVKAAWNFDEGSGTTANDLSGNGNHGTLTNSPAWVSGKFGNALNFNGSNTYVRRTSGTNMPLGSSKRTYMAWIKPTSYPNSTYNGIIAYGLTGASQGSLLSIKNDGRLSAAFWNNDTYQTTGTAIAVPASTWSHVAFTYAGGTKVKFYVNGQFMQESSLTAAPNTQNGVIRLGCTDDYGRVFNGAIDEIYVFDRELSAQEMSDIYNGYPKTISSGTLYLGALPQTEPTVTFNTEENDACYSFASGWTAGPGEVKSITTGTPSVPTLSCSNVKRISDKQIDITWSDTNSDETGFEIERCVGAVCDTLITVPVNAASYTHSDMTVVTGTTYSYKVRAYKTAGCSWQTAYSAPCSVTASIDAPTGLTATASNTTEVKLTWNESNVTETGFEIDRCDAPCDFTSGVTTLNAGVNAKFLIDSGVCNSKAYNYRIRSFKNGLSFSGGGCWTNKSALNITDFQQNYQTKLTITYASFPGMQTDFRDVRFYDETAGAELNYFIESKTDGVSAVVWLKTGSYNNISMYYGNSSATTASNPDSIFEFYDDFNGISIDTGKWTITDSTGFSVSGGVLLGTNTTGRLTSKTTFSSGVTLEIKAKTTTIATYGQMIGGFWLATNNGVGLGFYSATSKYTRYRYDSTWTYNYSAAPAANMLFTIKAKNSTTVNLQVYNLDTSSVYWNIGDVTNTVSAEPIVLGKNYDDSYTGYTYDTQWDWIRVRKYADTEPSVSFGAAVPDACYSIPNTWNTGYAGTTASPSVTTPTPTAMGTLTLTPISSKQIDLSWIYSGTDNTGFNLYRCKVDTGIDCTQNAQYSPLPSQSASTRSYSDKGLQSSSTYYYRVTAYKTTASCNWETAYAQQSATTTSITPDIITPISAPNTTQVILTWNDRTDNENAFMTERCIGAVCDTPVRIQPNNSNIGSYTDAGVCKNTTYTYRIKAVNDGVSNSGGGVWTKRKLLTINNFQTNFQTQVAVTYDADMKTDFSDVRFYDATAEMELPYWLEKKTDSSSAVFWVKTGVNNNVYMYYGNPSASSASNGDLTFEFIDAFRGTVIDTTNKWVEIDPNNSISQNNDLILNDVSDAWNKALISKQTFSRTADKMIYMKLTIPADTPGNNHFMVGWETDQTTDPSYTQLIHGLYWNNYLLTTYEKGNSTGPNNQPYVQNTDYEIRIVLKSTGANYYIKGGTYTNWTQIVPSTILNYNDATMRIAFTQYSHQANIHFITVQKYAATEPSVSVGSEEELLSGYVFNTWESPWSATANVTTPNSLTPTPFTATKYSEARIDLSWTYGSTDLTNFQVDRCPKAQGDCQDSDWGPITGSPFSASTTSNQNSVGVEANNTYTYRIRAHKDAIHSWDGDYAYASANTNVIAPSGLTLTSTNTTQVDLSWTDTNGTETGFFIERCPNTSANCNTDADFDSDTGDANPVTPVGTSTGTTYQDTKAAMGQIYTYRVKAYKTGTWTSAPSNKVQTSSRPTAVKPTNLKSTTYSENRIDLAWTDANSDETGFKIYRCEGTGCNNFAYHGSVTGATSYQDTTNVNNSTTYRYYVTAYKDVPVVGWETSGSDSAEATTTVRAPGNLQAFVVNSRKVNLTWDDNADDEDGFEIEMQVWNGRWVVIGTVKADVKNYTDTVPDVATGTDPAKVYRYRVRAYKGSARTQPSNEMSVTMPKWTANDDACVP